MAVSMKNVDEAFQGAGHKAGMEIWRIENFKPVPLPKDDYGKFYSGDSYVLLRTTVLKSGAFHSDIHFWLGKNTSQDEAGTAAIKAVELDAALGGRAVQHREAQGHETELFLSYFKPCLIPLEGGVASGFKKVEAETYETRLFLCKGRRTVRVKQVPFARSSLNHNDVFILDTENKIFQFNGQSSSISERAKALEVVQFIKDMDHEGKCEVIMIDDGKLGAEDDTGQFWVLFGGFAPLSKKGGNEQDLDLDVSAGKLFCISAGQLQEAKAGTLTREMLETNKNYILDCGAEIFVWLGRSTSLDDRKTASLLAEELIKSQKRSEYTQITKVIEGFETPIFRSNFNEWPLNSTPAVSEEGRGKVAGSKALTHVCCMLPALLKKQGVNVMGLVKGAPVKEEIPPLLPSGGKIEVWRVNDKVKTSVPPTEHGKFYSGDSYIVLYSYPGHDRKDEYFLCAWLGKHSPSNVQQAAIDLSTKLAKSKGRTVQGRVYEGKEPAYFLALFETMIILKGASGVIAEDNGSTACTLFRVHGTGPHDTQALQVDAVAGSLNSSECFVLMTRSTNFVWYGTSTSSDQQKVALKVSERLKPETTWKPLKEGSEAGAFWNALGGKNRYSGTQELKETGKDPRLYACTNTKGKGFSEIYNFDQDDLLSDDVLILDTFTEVFVWVGQRSTPQERMEAFSFGQRYIDLAVGNEGLSPFTPLYIVPEGYEPPFFTRCFMWDHAKAIAGSDSLERKLASVQGRPYQAMENNKRRVSGAGDTGSPSRLSEFCSPRQDGREGTGGGESEEGAPTQRAAALAALNSVWKSPPPGDVSRVVSAAKAQAPETQVAAGSSPDKAAVNVVSQFETSPSQAVSQRAAALAALSSVLDQGPEKNVQGDWVALSSPNQKVEVLDVSDGDSEYTVVSVKEVEANKSPNVFPFSQLRIDSSNPAPGIDATKREWYLSNDEFQKLFGMEKEEFYELPRWKQTQKKKQLDLF